MVSDYELLVIGAGPAGLTAAIEAIRMNKSTVVLEASDVVGGISRTVNVDGWRFDLGGHRFFTKVARVNEFWNKVLAPTDFLQRPRLSRIYYRGKYFDYPLKPINALIGLGPLETLRCVFSFILVKIRPPRDQSHFAGWVTARFGRRLFEIFFKTYTEKVWGIPTDKLSSAWAAQRIKNLSLLSAILNAFGLSKGKQITTLIDSFDYPRLGPGMMWERCASMVVSSPNAKLSFNEWPEKISRKDDKLVVVTNQGTYGASFIVSSMPLSELPRVLGCTDERVNVAASGLKYRDFLTVGLVVRGEETFPDNWIYIHSPDVKVGRIQNFRSWSPDLVKPGFTLLGLEYFVNLGDEYWEASDSDLVEIAISEICNLKLVERNRIESGYVVRVPKAYPVYDEEYQENVRVIADWLNAEWPEILPVGRNGMHRYNNQDHSMLTAMFAVENAFLGASHDLWSVNVENDYHESASSDSESFGGRAAPVFRK
jgi:protoporphyrinogen oxidase